MNACGAVISPRLPAGSQDWRPLSDRQLNNSKNIGSYLTKIGMHNLEITFHISGQLQPQSPSVEVVTDNNVSLSAEILKKTMNYHLRWRHVNTCCRVMCAYYAYVTIRRTLGVMCFRSHHFVNKVSGQHFSAENKKKQHNFILNICRCTLVASYERSNRNLTSRWVLAWSVQKWIYKVIIERWEAFGPSNLRGCRQPDTYMIVTVPMK